MKKSVGSIIGSNRRALAMLGVLLSLAVFTFITSQISAKDRTPADKTTQDNASSAAGDVSTAMPQTLPVSGPIKEGNVIVGHSYKNDESIPLRDMKPEPYTMKERERDAAENPKIPHVPHNNVPDEAIQDKNVSENSLLAPMVPSPLLSFDGIPFPGVGCNCAPPDTDGEVGATQYVQMVNEGFQVFNKTTGASVYGPVGITTVWSGFGGVCQSSGDGDPVVMYDQLANRWIITQFAGASVPTDECIAVSTTSDATGSWYRYGFHLGSNFFDYPHLGVWPDGYYMSMNVFNSAGTAFLGPQPFAFDRAKMLLGQPATFVSPGLTGASENSYLPADLEGSALPPAGAPATFVSVPFGGSYKVRHFHADFTTPANTTFSVFAQPAAAGFTELCATTRSCVPEQGVTSANKLDGLGDRLMYRLTTRFIGGHESTVGNFTVSANGVAGIRWFELRGVTNGPVTLFQESTYQPDTTWRWLGSSAMDGSGNIAVGFSASSSTMFPAIRYAARLASDPINTLAQGEATLHAGTGSQTGTGNRWGDYSDLTVDPSDDCTFWYTQEYYQATGTYNWRTRIGSFKLPGCGGAPTPTPTATATVAPSPTPTFTVGPSPTPTFTVAPSPTPTFTVAPSPTPTVAPTPTPVGNLIVNGGFEGSVSPWVGSGSGFFYTNNGNYPHGGTGYTYYGVNNNVTGQAYQTVSIPANASGSLNFWLNVTSSETTTTTAYDKLFVEVRNTSGTLLATLAQYSNLNKGTAGVYSLKSLNMSAYRGQTVRLQFRCTMDVSLTTTFRVDDVSLQ